MKTRLLLLLSFVLCMGEAYSQNDIIVFAEEGEKFTLFVNSVKQNETPSANVRAKDLTGEGALLRVVFEDESVTPLKKQIQFFEKNTEITAKVTMTNKGYKLKYFGAAPIGTAPEIAEREEVVEVIQTVPEVIEMSEAQSSSTTVVVEEVSSTTRIEEDESVNMNVDVNGFKLKLDVNVDGMDVDAGAGTSTTTTTITTTTIANGGTMDVNDDTSPQGHSVVVVDPCVQTTRDIAPIRSAIDEESFAEDKMNVAKQALRDQCIYVSGIKELANQFSFEDDRLEFVKFCYEHCADTENYYQLNSVFTFSDNKEALNSFLESQER